jgi:hypothetical protein
VATLLGNLAGALSLALLVKQGLSEGLVAPLQTLFDYYDAIIQFLLGWATTYVGPVGTFLAHGAGHKDFVLSPDWKHIFVALAIPAVAAWRTMSRAYLAEMSVAKELKGTKRLLALIDEYAASYLMLLFILMVIGLFASGTGILPDERTRFFLLGGAFALGCWFAMMIPVGGWTMSILNGDVEGERDAKALIKPMALNLFAIVFGCITFLLLNGGMKLAGL